MTDTATEPEELLVRLTNSTRYYAVTGQARSGLHRYYAPSERSLGPELDPFPSVEEAFGDDTFAVTPFKFDVGDVEITDEPQPIVVAFNKLQESWANTKLRVYDKLLSALATHSDDDHLSGLGDVIETSYPTAMSITISAAKQAFFEGFEKARRLASGLRILACLVETRETEQKKLQPTILEAFSGRVTRIDGDDATIELIDAAGRGALARCASVDLTCNGIEEGEAITCSVVQRGRGVELLYERVPRNRLTSESVAKIRTEVASDLANFDDEE